MYQPPQWGGQQGPQGWGPAGYPPQPQPPAASNSAKGLLLIAGLCGLCCLGAAMSPRTPAPTTAPAASAPSTIPGSPAPPASEPARATGAPASVDAGPTPTRAPTAADILRTASEHVATPTPADVLAYNAQLVDDLAAVNGIQDPERRTMRREIRATARAIERRRREIRGPVREAAEALALRTICGNRPSVGGWDGELLGSESYMRRTAHDPGSIDVENCTQPVLTRRNCWVSECTVRGRNAFGAMVANTVRFSVGAAGILGAQTL